MTTLPGHLGGHENETHVDEGAINYLIENLEVKSVLDIGCGPGGVVELCKNKGLDVLGVDGDFTVERPESIKDNVVIHDYSKGPYIPEKKYDLAWTVEFVEHVDEEYMPNFIETFKSCKYVIMTHALPGQPGHHHVNCQHAGYWLNVMEKNGFKPMPFTLQQVREASTMRERYIRQQSLFFKNLNFDGCV
jgi:SAM-dependent methyltransferase